MKCKWFLNCAFYQIQWWWLPALWLPPMVRILFQHLISNTCFCVIFVWFGLSSLLTKWFFLMFCQIVRMATHPLDKVATRCPTYTKVIKLTGTQLEMPALLTMDTWSELEMMLRICWCIFWQGERYWSHSLFFLLQTYVKNRISGMMRKREIMSDLLCGHKQFT